jgi:hypothetical protein
MQMNLRMFSRTAHPMCVHDSAHNYAEGFFFFAISNAYRPNISIIKYSTHEETNGVFPLITILGMLKFDTKDVDERYGSCTFFSHNDQKKVCFYKRPQMDFVKKAFIYGKP